MMQELNYIRCGDCYIPDIRLPEETRNRAEEIILREMIYEEDAV